MFLDVTTTILRVLGTRRRKASAQWDGKAQARGQTARLSCARAAGVAMAAPTHRGDMGSRIRKIKQFSQTVKA